MKYKSAVVDPNPPILSWVSSCACSTVSSQSIIYSSLQGYIYTSRVVKTKAGLYWTRWQPPLQGTWETTLWRTCLSRFLCSSQDININSYMLTNVLVEDSIYLSYEDSFCKLLKFIIIYFISWEFNHHSEVTEQHHTMRWDSTYKTAMTYSCSMMFSILWACVLPRGNLHNILDIVHRHACNST